MSTTTETQPFLVWSRRKVRRDPISRKPITASTCELQRSQILVLILALKIPRREACRFESGLGHQFRSRLCSRRGGFVAFRGHNKASNRGQRSSHGKERQ